MMATPAHLDDLMLLLRQYYYELPFFRNLTPDEAKHRTYRAEAIDRGMPHILAYVRRHPIGLVAWSYDHTFTVEPIAVMNEFFVIKPFRQTPVGRALLHHAMNIMRDEGAKIFRAEIASGLPEARTLRNLFRRKGGEEVGATMHMELS
jgi:GNAT superfamily N-acetyltransferase